MLEAIGIYKEDPIRIFTSITAMGIMVNFFGCETSRDQVIIFTSMQEFVQSQAKFLNKNVIGVVFDCLEQLSSANLEIVKKFNRRILPDILKHTKHRIFLTTKRNDIQAVLDKEHVNSFLHHYNGSLYTIVNKDLRMKIKAAVIDYIGSGTNLVQFNTAVNNLLPKRGKSREAIETITNLTNGMHGINLRNAIHFIVKQNGSVSAAVKKFGVFGFDVRYFLASMKSDTGAK